MCLRVRRLRFDVLANSDTELGGDAAISFSRSVDEARMQIGGDYGGDFHSGSAYRLGLYSVF